MKYKSKKGDFTQPNEDINAKTVLEFETKEELTATMQEVAQFFQN